ncbi:MAG: inositol monophosphatase family protein [Ilumatobacteraceae bacterium]
MLRRSPSMDPERLCEIAIAACTTGAAIAREGVDRRPVATKSTATDIVTATDLAAEEAIRSVLASQAPGSAVLGEEGGSVIGGAGAHGDIEWVVDPLDGTVNYAFGVPISAVSVAAVFRGRPIAGAVIDIARGETYSAVRGGGARCDDERLEVGSCRDSSLALVATGFAYDAARRTVHGEAVARLLPLVRDVRAFGSAALHLCWVAQGRIDLYFERDIKPWDHCAGALIATEAGAAVELPCPENDGLIVAANPVLARAVRPLLS